MLPTDLTTSTYVTHNENTIYTIDSALFPMYKRQIAWQRVYRKQNNDQFEQWLRIDLETKQVMINSMVSNKHGKHIHKAKTVYRHTEKNTV